MDIWIAERNRSGKWIVRTLDSGRADPEGVAAWLMTHNPEMILFFGMLSTEV